MNNDEVKKQYALLKDEIAFHADQYYNKDTLAIPDADYDNLFVQLQQMETLCPWLVTVDSPTQRVLGKASNEFKKVKHKVRMLSIRTETTLGAQGAIAFDSRIRRELQLSDNCLNIEYCCELKYDGLAINLRYIDGVLKQASTRGDSFTGEDVTHNVLNIKEIPKVLNHCTAGVLEVRGEVYMRKDDFDALNNKCRLLGIKTFVNPRNAAAGSIRQLSSTVSVERQLCFFAYGVGEVVDWDIPKTQFELLNKLKEFGLPVADTRAIANSPAGLTEFYESVGKQRDNLPFDIDGVVYKVNDFKLQQSLGFVGREPRWAVAHKYAPQEKTTVLRAIDIQVGRLGKLTPVARLDPISVGGTTVFNATMHNVFEIRRKKIRSGDIVIVRRAGDVVPEVMGCVLEKRKHYIRNFRIIPGLTTYPSCGGGVVREKGKIDYKCVAGVSCDSQRRQRLLHFFSRNAVCVNGIGEKLVHALVTNAGVMTPADVYKLDVKTLMSATNFGLENASKLIEKINASKQTTLSKFLYGLGIEDIGQRLSDKLSHYPLGIRGLMNDDLNTICDYLKNSGADRIDTFAISNLVGYFLDRDNKELVNNLLSLGITFENAPGGILKTHSTLTGKRIVITGALSTMSKNEAFSIIKQHGGFINSDVSSKTDLVIVGERPGKKLAKALELNIQTIDESVLAI